MNPVHQARLGSFASIAALMLLALPTASHAAQLMKATVSGTVSAGGDAYYNTVYFGPPVSGNVGGNLVGQQASVSIIYDADRFRPNYPGYAPNWSFTHQPGWPAFLGTAGQSPVLSGSFTVNGYTMPMDVTGAYETARLTAENRPYTPGYGEQDTWGLSGMDTRFTWCPNDGQCAEAVQLSASQSAGASSDMFGGQGNFDPANAFTAMASPTRSIFAYVRLMSVAGCKDAMCAPERFNDNQTHWVEFYVNGISLTVAPLSAVPEPETYALMLAGLAVVGSVARRRRG